MFFIIPLSLTHITLDPKFLSLFLSTLLKKNANLIIECIISFLNYNITLQKLRYFQFVTPKLKEVMMDVINFFVDHKCILI